MPDPKPACEACDAPATWTYDEGADQGPLAACDACHDARANDTDPADWTRRDWTGAEMLAAIHAGAPGIPATIEYTGGGCATIFAGTPYTDAAGDTRYPLVIGPGWWGADAPTFDPADTYAGPDDDGEAWPTAITELTQLTELARATFAPCTDCGRPAADHMTADELDAAGADAGLRDTGECAYRTPAPSYDR